jgi:hypothetical protein
MTPDPDQERLLVSKVRAAELLSISIDTFERLVMPEVRVVRIGRRVLFVVPDLAHWVDEHAAFSLRADLLHECSGQARCRSLARPLGRSTSGRSEAIVRQTPKKRAGAGLGPAPDP